MKKLAILLVLGLTVFAEKKPRQKMPAFRAKSMGGENLSNEALAGKPALIQLWATWCGYCRKDQPIVEKLASEFRDKGLVIVAVNVGEARQKVESYLKDHPRPGVKHVLTEDTSLPGLIAPQGFPFYVLLDKDGKVAGVQAGSGGEPSLREMLTEVGLGTN